MTITMIDRAMPRAERRKQTAELLHGGLRCEGRPRDELIDQVIVLNIGVAHAIAHRYRNRSVPVEDLEQVACMALVRAAHKFDVAQERDFLTYAVPTISGEIKRHFRDQGWTIRPPRRVQEIQSKVVNAYHHGEEQRRPAVAGQAGRAARTRRERRLRGPPGRGLLPAGLARRPGHRGRPRRSRPAHRRRGRRRAGARGQADARPGGEEAERRATGGSSTCASSRTAPSRRSATSSA